MTSPRCDPLALFLAMWVVVSGSAPAPVSAQVQSAAATSLPLMIEGKAFRIGMSRQEALTLLSECCYVPPEAASNDSMFIINKTGKAIVGGIFFRGGRVVGLRRHERQSQDKAVGEFILAFYRSVLNGQPTARAVVTVTAMPLEGGNFSGRTLTFTFSDGRILVLKHGLADDGTVAVDLEEER
jgi:hypothetical protein